MNPRPLTAIEREILSLLTDGAERFGLDLVEQSGGRVKRGTVYVTMNRLEDQGLVDSRREARPPGDPGIPRRMFRLTAEGRRVLAAAELGALRGVPV